VHFRLQPWESGHFLEDAGSGLGTLVNAKPVSWAPLKHGDVITAGDMRMVYETDDGGAVPEFPVENVPAAEAMTPGPDKMTEEASVAAGPEDPPAWLPPEALHQPVPPWARPSPQVPVSAGFERTVFIWVLILLLTAAAVWYYARGRYAGG
jgi:hypothetical protein